MSIRWKSSVWKCDKQKTKVATISQYLNAEWEAFVCKRALEARSRSSYLRWWDWAGEVRRGGKVNVRGWEMTRAEPRGRAQAGCDCSLQSHGAVNGGGCTGWAGAAALHRKFLQELGRARVQGLRDMPKQKVMPKLCAPLAGTLAGRRGMTQHPRGSWRRRDRFDALGWVLAGMLRKTKSESRQQDLGWKWPRRGQAERHTTRHAQDIQRCIRNGLDISILWNHLGIIHT